MPNGRVYIEAVHRLNDVGVAITYIASGTSQAGFDAEWRAVNVSTFDGDMISRSEIFDEADIDAALARFDELRPSPPRLENAVGRILERYRACFSAREWTAMSELLADDIVLDDRRRVVNEGVRRGREVHTAGLRAAVEVGAETISSTVVATRGERLALAHARAFNRGAPPGEVGAEWLVVAEIDSNERIVAIVVFDLDDIDAAYEELDARYLAGEAAPYAHIWTAITKVQAAYNRHEVPATTADWVNIDHRPGVAFAPGDATAYIGATYDVAPNVRGTSSCAPAGQSWGCRHRSSCWDLTRGLRFRMARGRPFAFEGDMVSRFEIFDETGLDAALARFDELHAQARRLENAAAKCASAFGSTSQPASGPRWQSL